MKVTAQYVVSQRTIDSAKGFSPVSEAYKEVAKQLESVNAGRVNFYERPWLDYSTNPPRERGVIVFAEGVTA